MKSSVALAEQGGCRVCRYCWEVKDLAEFPVTRGKIFYKCRNCTGAQITEWCKRNREQSNSIKRKHRAANREAEASRAREAYAENKTVLRPRLNEYQREWRRANAELQRSYLAKRRKQCRAPGQCYAASDVKRLYVEQRGRCAEETCRASIKAAYHVDHIMPLSKGGPNAATNIQLLCPPCNYRKRDLDPADWARMNGRLL